MKDYEDALYTIAFMSRDYFYGDRPPRYIEEQLKNIDANPKEIFLKILGLEERIKELFGKDTYLRFSETELIYTPDKFILRLNVWSLNNDLAKNKLGLYRYINKEDEKGRRDYNWYAEWII